LHILAALAYAILISGCTDRSRIDNQTPILPVLDRSTGDTSWVPPNKEDQGGAAPGNASESRQARSSHIYPGTGIFVNSPGPEVQDASSSSAGDITLNFVNTPINEVLDAVLGKILEFNYAVDTSLEGSITIQTSRPLSRESLLPTLEAVLSLAGAAIVEVNGLHKVVRRESALQGGAPFSRGSFAAAPSQGFSVLVVPLQYVSAEKMLEILEPLGPADSILRVDKARNVLVLVGTRQELSTLSEAIRIFDVDWLRGMSFGMFPLQFVDANTLAAELEKLFGEGGKVDLDGLISFVPIERLNTILVISHQADYVAQAQIWIERLDRSEDGTGRRVYVYHVQNGRAGHLAEALTELFADEQTSETEEPFGLAPGLTPVVIESEIQDTDSPADTAAETALSIDRGRDASGPPSAPDSGGVEFVAASGVRIIPDQENNALLILATPQEYEMIESTLRQLDIVPLQVLVQASLFEVTLNDELDYGVRWFLESGDHTLAMNNLPALLGGPAFSYAFSSSDFEATIEALAGITDLKVISAPEIMVLDNQTATIEIGDQVPVATRTSQGVTSPDAPIVNDIQYRDTGVILKVTPRVNAGGLVIMDVRQEVSDVEPTVDPTVTPTIFQRTIASTIAVQSGESVALGGLISQNTQTSQSGVPLLMDIPGVGALFRSTSEGARRRELIVIITPRMIRNPGDARQATDELRQRMGRVHRLIQRHEPKVEPGPAESSGPGLEESSAEPSPATEREESDDGAGVSDASMANGTLLSETARPGDVPENGEATEIRTQSPTGLDTHEVSLGRTGVDGAANGATSESVVVEARVNGTADNMVLSRTDSPGEQLIRATEEAVGGNPSRKGEPDCQSETEGSCGSQQDGTPARVQTSVINYPNPEDMDEAIALIDELGSFFAILAETDPNPFAKRRWEESYARHAGAAEKLQQMRQDGRIRADRLEAGVQGRIEDGTILIDSALAGAIPMQTTGGPAQIANHGWNIASLLSSVLVESLVSLEARPDPHWFQVRLRHARLDAEVDNVSSRGMTSHLTRYFFLKDKYLWISLRATSSTGSMREVWMRRLSDTHRETLVFLETSEQGYGSALAEALAQDWRDYQDVVSTMSSNRWWLAVGPSGQSG
jgi:general secretion pathway protein D